MVVWLLERIQLLLGYDRSAKADGTIMASCASCNDELIPKGEVM